MRQVVCRIGKFYNYIQGMFPYNDEENAWISGVSTSKIKSGKHSLIYSFIFTLFASIFSTILPPLIYFFRTDIF